MGIELNKSINHSLNAGRAPVRSISLFRGIHVPMKPVVVAALGHDRPVGIGALGYDNPVRLVRVSTLSLTICITSVIITQIYYQRSCLQV